MLYSSQVHNVIGLSVCTSSGYTIAICITLHRPLFEEQAHLRHFGVFRGLSGIADACYDPNLLHNFCWHQTTRDPDYTGTTTRVYNY